jgi:hypothetical protein
VIGGYDFAKQKGSDFMRGKLIGGMPRIQLMGINMHNPDTHEIMTNSETPIEAEIDSSLPYIYLPVDLATRMRDHRQNFIQDDGTLTRERQLGNISMTVRLLEGANVGVRELNITFPESSKPPFPSYSHFSKANIRQLK